MKETSSLILVRHRSEPEFFWARRGDDDRFLSGFHVFPGGAVEPIDLERGGDDVEVAARHAALRETHEETGCDLRSAGIDALIPAGCWTAPAYLVKAFRTRFYLTRCNGDPRTENGDGELSAGEWVTPHEALERWRRHEVLLAPPTRHLIEAMAAGALDDPELFVQTDESRGQAPTFGAVRTHIMMMPLRTPTLPPATHTNCYIIGDRELLIIEPASPYDEERERLDRYIDARLREGCSVKAIVLTHHHHDHIGGVRHLAERLKVPVWAHAATADRVPFDVERHLKHGEMISVDGGHELEVVHTPGHALGHLCFYDQTSGSMVAGDMVAGVGTILIEPEEGDMRAYLDSLMTMRKLEPTCLLPSHGPPIGGAVSRLEDYHRHRLMREEKAFSALTEAPQTIKALVDVVYDDAPPMVRMGPNGGLAGLSLRTHLAKLLADGRAHQHDDGCWSS